MKGLLCSAVAATVVATGVVLPSITHRQQYLPPWICEVIPVFCDR